MDHPYTGGCACGGLRYRITSEPLVSTDCQCHDCQSESGTGHASHLVFASDTVTLTGEAATWDMTGDSGNTKTRGFCPRCGSPVFMTFAATADVMTVRAASLDDPGRYHPQMVLYTARGHAWDHLDPALPKHAGMPPS